MPLLAQQTRPAAPRIVQYIDTTVLVPLTGNTHPLARAEYQQEAAPPDLPMERMLLLLRRGPEQEAALLRLLDDQQDPGSVHYHQWLTPEQFGDQFGPAPEDVDNIVGWLKSQGFRVDSVANGRTVVEFSGTAGQVESGLHTPINRYLVNGESHWANARDPRIPAALSPVVAGFVSLNNFPKKALHHSAGGFRQAPGGGWAPAGLAPEYTIYQSGLLIGLLAPYDFATIYNVLPLWNAGIDGTGQKIAIAGRSHIAIQDVRNFRSVFGLPANDPIITVNGPDPGRGNVGDEGENDSDVEWAGAVAKGATINLVVSQSTAATDGADLSAQYIVNNNLAPVLSYSYGECEARAATNNQFMYNMWQQAAAQGITVAVSAGDSGSAGCDSPSNLAAMTGLAVNGSASTPYNVAVGGTDFADVLSSAAHWNSANDPATLESAKSYVPETTWNDSCASPDMISFYGTQVGSPTAEALCNNASTKFLLTLGGGGGGASSLYPKPAWQTGVVGIPSDGHRDLPDVALFAGDGAWLHAYAVCQADNGGPCDKSNGAAGLTVEMIGGTSLGTPAFAGMMALVNQKTGSRQGLANPKLYSLAAAEYGSSSSQNWANQQACKASAPPAPGNTCVFYDVTTGNNDVPCLAGSLNCYTSNGADTYGIVSTSSNSPAPAYSAGTGYDLATGLGSLNAANLVNGWGTGGSNPASLTISKTHSGTFSQGQTGAMYTVTVANAASAAPTSGAVTVTENPPSGLTVVSMAGSGWNCSGSTCARSDVLSAGYSYPAIAVSVNIASNAPSQVTNQATVAGGGSSSATASDLTAIGTLCCVLIPTTTTEAASPVSILTTASTTLTATVTANSGSGTPTGTVAFAAGSVTLNTATLTGSGGTALATAVIYGSQLSLGSNTITASYSGDANNRNSSATTTVTVTQSTVTPSGYTITTVAGNGTSGYAGDGGLATSAQLRRPEGVAMDSAGNLFIADYLNNRVRKVTPAGTISTVAGNGNGGFSGDGSPATAAELYWPTGVAVDSAGNLFIADYMNERVRKVTPAGTISTVAGTGTGGFNGDGGPATSAELWSPTGVAVDSAGNLFIAELTGYRVRKVTPAGTIGTVAGNGIPGYGGDGGPATSAGLDFPDGVAVDGAGNLFIADRGNNFIRKVTPGGTISRVAGNGSQGFSGDGGPATSAALNSPMRVAVDSAGNLFIADTGNGRIRQITPAGTISTVAGNGTPGFSGDGGPATSAGLDPSDVAVDSAGNVFIADTGSNRIRKLTAAAPATSAALTIAKTHSGSFSQGQTGATYTVTVSNAASAGPTSGAVTVAENPPAGLTVASMAGSGWSCTGATCTRSDVLSAGSSFPAITVTVNVASTAPSQVTNQATVSGGGSNSITASDVTKVTQGYTPMPVTATPSTIDTTGSTTLVASVGIFTYTGPTGRVTFSLGSKVLGSAAVMMDGAGFLLATLTVSGSQLAVGANIITANYSGDANYSAWSGSVTVTVTAPSSPTITMVENAASYQAGFASGTWVAILGANLSSTTRLWQDSDFVNGLLPTSLSGVSVTINGRPAYVEYISPTQINVLAPDDATVGAVQVQVTTAGVPSNSYAAQKQQLSPAMFLFPGGYAAAQHADYSPVAKPGLFAGTATTAAAPGEMVIIWATGFGPSSPPLPAGQTVTAPAVLANSVTFTIGGLAAPVIYAGLAGSGLYQFNVTVPSLPNGDATVLAQVGGVQTPAGVLISVQSSLPGPAAPQIASLSPATGAPGTSVPLVISGSNLSNVSSVQFSPSAGIAVSNVNATATQVTATVTIAAGTPTGQTNVSVSVWPSAGISNALAFTVVAAGPQIASLSPASGSPGSTVSLSIAGSNLSSVTGIQFSPSTGIAVSNVNATATQVTATVTIAASAPAGQVSVSVSSPAGASNALMFTLLSPAPQITSLNPASGSPGSTVSLAIAGNNLSGVTGIQFSPSTGITVSNVSATATQVTATLTIASSASAGQRNISVSSPAGNSNALIFTIQALAPQVAYLSPTGGSQGSTVSLSIAGSNLSTVTGVQFSPSTGITVSGVNATATQVTATVTIAATAPTGQLSVSVSSPTGTSNALVFTILASAPHITSLNPASGSPGSTVSLSIAGSNLSSVTGVQFSPSTGITVSNVNATAAQVTAMVTIASSAPTGQVSVSVSSPTGTSNTLVFTIQAPPPANATWSGTTSQQLPVSIATANNSVTAYSYSISFPNLAANCPTGETVTSAAGYSIPITGSSFANSSISGTFQSPTQVSGTINWAITLPGCAASGTVTWSAVKQQ
jgi:uncharacterized protein (TIGR03437 family)